MRYRIYLFTLMGVLGLVSVGFSQDAANQVEEPSVSVPAMSVSESPSYPYLAEITGNDVYIRSGPGINYYECGKLYKGDKVTIVGDMDGVWSKILPLNDSFSWISADLVKIDSTDPTIGEVTGDNVRVYAGSDYVRPETSATQHGKLNKGDKVKLLGEQLNKYYKIAVPSLPNAYFWVSTQYTKPITPELPKTPKTDPLVDEPEDQETVIGSDESPNITVDPMDEIQETPAVPVTPLEMYHELTEKIDAERAKPFDEQDYTAIKEALQEIIDNEEAGKAGRYAEAQIQRIEGFELALEVGNVVKLQNEQLQQAREQIDKAHTRRLEEVKNLGRYAVIGTLENFITFGEGHYRIVSESDQTICYAVPSEKASGKDLSGLIGKKVGLVGSIKPSSQTAGAMVQFDEVVPLE